MAFGFTYTLPTITGTHTNFPVCLRTAEFPTAALDGGANSLANGGGDLRAYTDSGKATVIPLEVITLVTGGSPNALVWSLIPSGFTGATIYLEADSVATAQPAVGAAGGRNAVWVDYEAVLHLSETGDGTAGEYLDSTGNGRDGQLTNGTAPPVAISTGHPFGGTWSGFGNTHAITLANTLNILNGSPFNFSIYYNVTLLNNSKGLFGFRYNDSADYAQMKLNGQVRVNGTTGDVTAIGTQAAVSTTSRMQANVSAAAVVYFQDGVQEASAANQIVANHGNFRIGTYFDASSERFINGNACEARIRKSVLIPDWITTEQAMQQATTWGTVGTWADSGGGNTGAFQSEPATMSGSASVSSVGYDLGAVPICRYYVNEAPSGTGPTVTVDEVDSNNNLANDYGTGGDKANYVTNATGRGIDFTNTVVTAGSAKLSLDDLTNGSIKNLVGKQKITLINVVTIITGHSNGARISHIGTNTGNGDLGLVAEASRMVVRWNRDDGSSGTTITYGNGTLPTIRTVMIVKIDTTEAVAADRCKLYFNDSLQTINGGTIPLNDTLNNIGTASYSLVLGNRPSSDRNFQGNLSYFELFDGLLSTAEINEATTALLASDDANWKVLASGITASGAFGSQPATMNSTATLPKSSNGAFLSEPATMNSASTRISVVSSAALASQAATLNSSATRVLPITLAALTSEAATLNSTGKHEFPASAAFTSEAATFTSTGKRILPIGASAISSEPATMNAASKRIVVGQAMALASEPATLNAVGSSGAELTGSLVSEPATMNATSKKTIVASAVLASAVATMNANSIRTVVASGAFASEVATMNANAGSVTTSTGAFVSEAATMNAASKRVLPAMGAFQSENATLNSTSLLTHIIGVTALASEPATMNATMGKGPVASGTLLSEPATLNSSGIVGSGATGAFQSEAATLNANAIRILVVQSAAFASEPATLNSDSTLVHAGAATFQSEPATLNSAASRVSVVSSAALQSPVATLNGAGLVFTGVTASGTLQSQPATLNSTSTLIHTAVATLASALATLNAPATVITAASGSFASEVATMVAVQIPDIDTPESRRSEVTGDAGRRAPLSVGQSRRSQVNT